MLNSVIKSNGEVWNIKSHEVEEVLEEGGRPKKQFLSVYTSLGTESPVKITITLAFIHRCKLFDYCCLTIVVVSLYYHIDIGDHLIRIFTVSMQFSVHANAPLLPFSSLILQRTWDQSNTFVGPIKSNYQVFYVFMIHDAILSQTSLVDPFCPVLYNPFCIDPSLPAPR
jgi:hypothetical protein